MVYGLNGAEIVFNPSATVGGLRFVNAAWLSKTLFLVSSDNCISSAINLVNHCGESRPETLQSPTAILQLESIE